MNGRADSAVTVRHLCKSFGKGDARTVALDGADFDARQGELMLIVGESGCGKTTLLSLIAGTLAPDSGEIDVFGTPLHSLKKSRITEFRRRNIGFIFQQFNLVPTLTLSENVSVPMLLNGASRRKAEAAADAVLERVGLAGRQKNYPRQLSGGQQQRVAIARALVHEPRLVICDEPTSALDKETGHRVMELLREVARSPERSVLVVTHDPRIFSFGDRMTEMEDGKVIRVMEGAEIQAHA